MQESRSYTHTKCRTETAVDGPEFSAMSNPMAGMHSTYCVACEDHFPVAEFAWSDTKELISKYYARHRKTASASDIWWSGRGALVTLAGVGFVAGILLGVMMSVTSGWLIGLIGGVVFAIIGAILGVVVQQTLFSRRIVKRVCGVDDTRMLR